MLSSKYLDQVALLIDIIPVLGSNKKFAIKGGTAINLFILDFPRLSVDIDLCYVPLTTREEALSDIKDFIKTSSRRLNELGLKTREKKTSDGDETTIFVRSNNVEVKVEINLVVRGAVYSPTIRMLTNPVQNMFKRSAEMLCLHPNDLYGGKICAALDRQNPRDFFDLYCFFKKNSYSRELHKTFMIYLLSSKRPISDLIVPNKQDLTISYEKLFAGMSELDVDCVMLEKTRDTLFDLVKNSFTDKDKEFLMSFKKGEPLWDLFAIENAKEFPSIKWKLYNIQNMDEKKRIELLKKLEAKLW